MNKVLINCWQNKRGFKMSWSHRAVRQIRFHTAISTQVSESNLFSWPNMQRCQHSGLTTIFHLSTHGSFFLFKFTSFQSIQSFWTFSMAKNILFIDFRDYDILKSNQYWQSTLRGSQQSNCFTTQLDDFDYFTAQKYLNLGNWMITW